MARGKSCNVGAPYTRQIAGILKQYPDGSQIARELLQNSDDAGSKEQWYLLDHHDYSSKDDGDKLRLFNSGFKDYLGPALLAGNDSVFRQEDFTSMQDLANSVKRADNVKIGQMGIGFNSIYHMTDFPSFISGSEFMVIDPHQWVLTERGNCRQDTFTDDQENPEFYPDQLGTFDVRDIDTKIDFSKPYDGTIFRFPLRTKKHAMDSDISKKPYTTEKVQLMFQNLKREALKSMLFLRNIERIVIYERKSLAEGPKKLFQIEITNADEVREVRQGLLGKLVTHLHPSSANCRTNANLEYSIEPNFRLTQEDGTETYERWRVSALIGDVQVSMEHISQETGNDIENLSDQKLIPWVGIAAPSTQGVNISDTGKPGLFCFLPIDVSTSPPFPVHINGHFAVKPSRNDIWTEQVGNSNDSAASINSKWNTHLFKTHIPMTYAKFLVEMGCTHGPNYDLWPVSSTVDSGIQGLWKNLLVDVLKIILKDNLKVFFCDRGNNITDYHSAYIAGSDLNKKPLLLKALEGIDILVTGLPDAVLEAIPDTAKSLGLENWILTPALMRDMLRSHKDEWSESATPKARIQILKYCMEDDEIDDLEGLPLLPLANGEWVEFEASKARSRFLVPKNYLSLLQRSNAGLVDVTLDNSLDFMFCENKKFNVFWSKPTSNMMATKIRDIFKRSSSPGVTRAAFPNHKWIVDFWNIIRDGNFSASLLSNLEGLNLLPLNNGTFGTLSKDCKVAYFDSAKERYRNTLRPFFDILSQELGCLVLLSGTGNWEDIATDYVFEIEDAVKTIEVLSRISSHKLVSLNNDQRITTYKYISSQLKTKLYPRLISTLKMLPIYQTFDKLQYVSVQYPSCDASQWRVVRTFRFSDHPWPPKSVKLLDGTHLGNGYLNLSISNSIPEYTEHQYWVDILSRLEKYPTDQWDRIFLAFSARYSDLVRCKGRDEFQSILIDLPFVPVTNPQKHHAGSTRLKPRQVMSTTLSKYFLETDCVFPKGEYANSLAFDALVKIGIQFAVDEEFILNRVEALAKHAETYGAMKISTPMTNIYSEIENSFYLQKFTAASLAPLCSISWILAEHPNGEIRCFKPAECRSQKHSHLVQSQMPIATYRFSNEKLFALLDWNQPPPLDKVLPRFLSLIKTGSNYTGRNFAITTDLAIKFYTYFNIMMANSYALTSMKDQLRDKPWILIGDRLYAAAKVTLRSSLDLRPHFVQCNLTGFDDLFLAMGARENVSPADLQSMIADINAKYTEYEMIPDDEAELVVELLKGVANENGYRRDPNLWVLADDRMMYELDEVVFDDTNARNDEVIREVVCGEDSDYIFLSDRISRELAIKLGVTMFSARYWENLKDVEFETWSQEVAVMDRINTFLNDYDPADIFTEFLQNAADAGATKFKFILDKRSFETDNLLGPNMAEWQGPALIVCNDAKFTKEDFRGLCIIDKGSKKRDSTKIGRHGLGFNSVYHFTDVPSVVSGSHVGFFDPQRAYLPPRHTSKGDVPQAGIKCDFTQGSGNAYSDQWQPYVGHLDCSMESHFEGTVFRIPLRTNDVTLRGTHVGRRWKLPEVEDMVKSWVNEGQIGMLFLEKIDTIEISIMTDRPNDKSHFSWIAKKSFGSKNDISLKNNFFRIDKEAGTDDQAQKEKNTKKEAGGGGGKKARRRGKKEKDGVPPAKKSDGDENPEISDFMVEALKKEEGYRARVIEIKSSSDNSPSETFQWMILTNNRFPEGAPESIIQLGNKHRWHPHAGVAIPLNIFEKSKTKFQGRIFTHLPTPMETGLPFHIHAGFALTSNRKSLAGKKEKQSEWNNYLWQICLPEVVKRAFINLLVLRVWRIQNRAEIKGAIEDYFKYWPTKSNEITKLFVHSLLRIFHSSPVFPIEGSQIRILKGSDVDFLGLGGSVTEDLENIIYEYLVKMGKNVSQCPTPTQTQLFSAWRSSSPPSEYPSLGYTVVNPQYILRIISEDRGFILDNIVDVQHKKWIVGFTLKELLKSTDLTEEYLDSLNLVPIMDGTWKSLSPSSTCFIVEDNMAHLISNKSLLLDKSIFYGTESNPNPNQGLLKELESRNFGISRITKSKFTEIFNTENPNGPSEEMKSKLFAMLRGYEDLEPFLDLLILRGTDGNIYPLRHSRRIDISQAPELRATIEFLTEFLTDLGCVVFDRSDNLTHQYFNCRPRVTPVVILEYLSSPEAIEKLTESSEVPRDTAKTIRDLICNTTTIPGDYLSSLGKLRIWPSYLSDTNSREENLIKADGSRFLDYSNTLDNLGDYPDVIYGYRNKAVLESLGAICLDVVSSFTDRVIPRFLEGTLACTGNTKNSYISHMINYCATVSRSGWESRKPGRVNSQLVLTRNGDFKCSRELFTPRDALIEAIFGENPSLLPDEELWTQIRRNNLESMFRFKNSLDPDTVVECAEHIVSLINETSQQGNPSIHEKSSTFVKFLISHYESNRHHDWMNMVIVPIDGSRRSLLHENLPLFPKYMSFNELMDPAHYEVCWTQHAFFPEALKPRGSMILYNSSIGKPKVATVVNHLAALVTDIAELTTSKDGRTKFRESLFATYEWLNECATNGSDTEKITLREELGKITRPYILNGKRKLPSQEASWGWPNKLVLDMDDEVCEYAVDTTILEYREFLIAAGVKNLKKTNHRVAKPVVRMSGIIEGFLLKCFRTQDLDNGHMDVVFRFHRGEKIMAHKFVLKFVNKHFATLFNGVWGTGATTDIEYPGMDVIEMDEELFNFEAFAGLLYYFYTNQLINEQEPIPGTSDRVNIQRLEFLQMLLKAAHYYDDPALMDLIAIDVLENHMDEPNGFMDTYHAAKRYGSEMFKESCIDHFNKNKDYFVGTHKQEIENCQEVLGSLTDGDDEKRANLEMKISNLESELQEFDEIANQK
ncbi:hypothetical protein BGZ76_000415 [Entomortierella beljakovae]|nr:hypothetical protein BGZ76_000415 [Entomortierella beljakovae]